MKAILVPFICVFLVISLLLTGCVESQSTVSQPINSPEPASDQKPIIPQTVTTQFQSDTNTNARTLDQQPNKPSSQTIQDLQKDYETGKPKEEPNISVAGQLVKLSKLKPIYSVDSGTVAITIDDGPTQYTDELLKMLREMDTKVTFFFIGQNVTEFPQSVTKAVYDGNVVGYHSNSHPKMTNMTLKAQENEFDLGLEKLKKLDSNPITLFRPPYGAYNNDTKVVIDEHHMNMVLWNDDPRDWSTSDPVLITKKVLSQVHSGSIIVMHDRKSTIAALPNIIKEIKKKGLKLVTIRS
jgi:peptidoglycan/xylan/chitin deacetylase (PgdA/CDA1 family)